MEALLIASLIVSVISAGYGIYSNYQQQQFAQDVNKQNQSNFENQYKITTKDMENSGINPMSMFNGGSLNNFVSGQTPNIASDNPFGNLLEQFQNISNNSLRRNEIENQKALQEADIDLKKAETVSKLLENENFKAMMQSESGNLFVRKLFSELGLNDSARALNVSMSDYYDEYHDRQQKLQDSINQTNKDIAKLNSDTQKEIQASEQKFQKEIKKIQYLNEHLSAREQDFFARRIAFLQSKYKVEDSIVTKVLDSQFLKESVGVSMSLVESNTLANSILKSFNIVSSDANYKADKDFISELNLILSQLTSD